MANQKKVTLVAVGDLAFSDNPELKLALATPLLREADIAFGQLEEILSERVNPAWNWAVPKNPAEVGRALANAGFKVISTASNFHMLGGPEACVDTLNILKENKILPVGVGMNIAEARTPAIVERKGTKVAFLGYSSTIPKGGEIPWEARSNRPGCAPMFINTFYDQIDDQPGTPPRIITFAEKENLADMEEDIKKAKAQADVVVMSIHWGIHHIPAVIAMYEYEVGHAAIDAGVDLILGTGPHLLKGIEVYKGKVIFHSLGNFSMTRSFTPGLRGYWEDKRHVSYAPWEDISPHGPPGSGQYPTFRYPEERTITMFTKCIISGKKIERVSFQPGKVNEAKQPEPLSRKEKKSDEIYQYVEWACKEAGMDTKFSREGDEVVVLT